MWRAGLPCLGLRSRPDKQERGVSDTPPTDCLGLLRSPTRGKPARHSGGYVVWLDVSAACSANSCWINAAIIARYTCSVTSGLAPTASDKPHTLAITCSTRCGALTPSASFLKRAAWET